MVSYYPTAMYRQPQISAPNGHFQTSSPMPWYHQSFHQNPQLAAPSSYCVQDEQQMWHSHHAPHTVFAHDYQDYAHGGMQAMQHPQHQVQPETVPISPVTVSGSDMSSPGAHSGTVSPQLNHSQNNTRPAPARSPFEWIKKTSYQSQPNPGKTRTKDKYRVVYTDHQRIELEKEFTFNNKYITIRRKTELATSLGLSERQIKIWFQNRRAKERKQSKKRAEEKTHIEIINNSPYQQNMINQQQAIQQLELHNQQAIIPNIIPSANVVMQRFIENTAMKMENSENEQMA